MNDLRTDWYRQRAAEEGQAAFYWLRTFRIRCSQRTASYFYPPSVEQAEENSYDRAREAAHYANLVLGPEVEPDVVCEHGTAMDVHCCGCHSGFLFDSRKCVCF